MVLLARDLSEIRVGNRRIRAIENNVVEYIECIGTEFEVSPFSQPYVELSGQSQVEFVTHRIGVRVHPFLAVRVRRGRREGGWIQPRDPRRNLVSPNLRVANHVHPLLEATAHILRVVTVGHGKTLPGTELHEAAQPPSTGRIGDQPAGRMGEW